MSKPKSRKKDWEQILDSEGLQPLTDSSKYGVSNKGAGKLKDANQALNRSQSATDMERRQHLLKTYEFKSKLDREIWQLYTTGMGMIAIAKRLDLSQRYTRTLVAKVKAYQPRNHTISYLVKQSGALILFELLNVLDKLKGMNAKKASN